jgi:hypothetical protein
MPSWSRWGKLDLYLHRGNSKDLVFISAITQ